jgi:hypothetical protein
MASSSGSGDQVIVVAAVDLAGEHPHDGLELVEHHIAASAPEGGVAERG